MKYNFNFSVDVCGLLPSVGKIFDEINENMRQFGFHEKIGIRSSCITTILDTGSLIPLTKEQLQKCGDIMLNGLQEKFPDYKFILESID